MKKFVINEFLTLKLEEGKTNIYVNDERFNQCKYLMLTIPIENPEQFDGIESIDEAADKLGWTEERQEGIEYDIYGIPPRTEFWGHCSNLQAWYEHDYDTRLLHSNLAFPLLKKLADEGDPLAKKVFREEIAKRFESGYPTVIAYIFKAQILDSFNKEERRALIKESVPVILTAIERLPRNTSSILRSQIFNSLIDESKGTEVLEKNFTEFLKSLDKFPVYNKSRSFSYMFDSIKDTELLKLYSSQIKTQFFALLESLGLSSPEFFKFVKETDYIEENFSLFLKTIEKCAKEGGRYTFSALINLAKETICKEDNFPLFLESIKNILQLDKHRAFSGLVNAEKASEWNVEQYYAFLKNVDSVLGQYTSRRFSYLLNVANKTGRIEEYIPAFFETIEKLPSSDRIDAFSNLLELTKEAGSIEEYIPLFLETIEKLSWQYKAYSSLLELTKETGSIEKHITAFLKTIEKLYRNEQRAAFLSLLELTKESELIEENLPTFLESITKLHDGNINPAFSGLIKISNEAGWIKKHIPSFLKCIEKFTGNHKYDTFYVLINSIKSTGLLNKYYSQIETQFFTLLDNIDKLLDEDKYGAFSGILEVTKETELIEKNFLFCLESIKKINNRSIYPAFSSLINTIKSTELLDKYYSQIETFFLVLLVLINKIEYRKYHAFSDLFQVAKDIGWIEELFSSFLESIDDMSMYIFSDLFSLAKKKGWIEEQFHYFLGAIDRVNTRDRYDAFSMLFKELKETSWIEEQFLYVLKTINKVPSNAMCHAFSDLINFAKSKDLYDTYYSQIETQFLVHLKNIKNICDSGKYQMHEKNYSYRYLLDIAKETGWIEKHFSAFLEPFVNIEAPGLYYAFNALMDFVKSTNLLKIHYSQIETQFLVLLNSIDNLDDTEKYLAFSPLINSAKNTDILSNNHSQIETQFLAIWKSLDKLQEGFSDKELYNFFGVLREAGLIENNILVLLETIGKLPFGNEVTSFSILINVAKERYEIEEYFTSFLNAIDKLSEEVKYISFYNLIKSIKSPEVFKKNYSQIESKFLTLLNNFDNIPEFDKYNPFRYLLGAAEKSNLLEEYFLAFLELINKIDYKQYELFSHLFKIAIENGWVEDFFPAILETIDELSAEDKYSAFFEVMDTIKGADLINELISDIKNPFLILLNNINQLKIMSDDGAIIVDYTVPLQLNTFANLINSIKNTELLKEFYPQIKSQIQTLVNRYGIYSIFKSKYIEFFKAIKGTELENEPEFKKWKEKNSI